MGKRSDFKRVPRDFYPTPLSAVKPLVQLFSGSHFTYAEPCAGDGRLIQHLATVLPNLICLDASDIDPRASDIRLADARVVLASDNTQGFITNPPWDRDILHPLITHLSDQRPTVLLFDADWIHTKQSIPFLDRLVGVVSVGRVKWIEGSKQTGKDNCAWYMFDKPQKDRITFFMGRTND